MKRTILQLGLFALVILVTGCGAPQPAESENAAAAPTPEPPTKPIIGATLLTQSHVFYQDLAAALEETAAEKGMEIRIQYCEFDGAKQNEQMETYILQKVDAILITPHDSDAVSPVIADARAAGIPVFTADIAAHEADIVSHIASDNVHGGRLVGEYLAEAIGYTGKIAIIDHPIVRSVIDRTDGFEEAIKEYPTIEIVSRPAAEGLRDKSLRAAQDLLQAEPDIVGIFGINDDTALGALAAVEELGLEEKIVIVGFDGTPEARDAIQRGTALKADAVQHPKDIGRTTIETIATHLGGGMVERVIPVPVELISYESLNEATQ